MWRPLLWLTWPLLRCASSPLLTVEVRPEDAAWADAMQMPLAALRLAIAKSRHADEHDVVVRVDDLLDGAAAVAAKQDGGALDGGQRRGPHVHLRVRSVASRVLGRRRVSVAVAEGAVDGVPSLARAYGIPQG